ncbi:MAG TPA: aminotransferase class III-fold pyridoxal phosphate-dependent enzyme [Polyangiaceae bacterium]|nr:aminotransferase class III-fold pyridoxal phosphate-dependent enzyme [Polyangiaceae bacterium]
MPPLSESGPGRLGEELPALVTDVPGPASRAWLSRFAAVAAPMGPRAAAPAPGEPSGAGTIVYHEGVGSNVVDVDGNRYVDLAAGFGSLLLGHRPRGVRRALGEQADRLLQSLGDLHPSDVKICLLERLALRVGGAQGILGQSGADALSAALKSAVLHTGRAGVVAFAGAYHGLSYGPLALCGLRESYRAPFAAQLNPSVRFVDFPGQPAALAPALAAVRRELERGDVGAVVFEPILGRGGVVVPPPGFAEGLSALCREHGAALVADEVWTGLGRSGEWLASHARGVVPDVVCLGKGLGGGLPISACLGRSELMAAWSRAEEVVHTSTFAGAPLAAAGALATLDALESQGLVERSRRLGAAFAAALRAEFPAAWPRGWEVRGAGLMLGVDLGPCNTSALQLSRALLARGYVVSLGGGGRGSLVLTPALDVAEAQLEAFTRAFGASLRASS